MTTRIRVSGSAVDYGRLQVRVHPEREGGYVALLDPDSTQPWILERLAQSGRLAGRGATQQAAVRSLRAKCRAVIA